MANYNTKGIGNYIHYHVDRYRTYDIGTKEMGSVISYGAAFAEAKNKIKDLYLSKLKASEVYDNLVNWAKEYDVDFYNLIPLLLLYQMLMKSYFHLYLIKV